MQLVAFATQFVFFSKRLRLGTSALFETLDYMLALSFTQRTS